MSERIGVLLLNIGTPAAPMEEPVREYLQEFLSDPLVVDYPRWFWQPILNRIILRKRPERSARLYASIWQGSGSPLLTITEAIASGIAAASPGWHTAVGMRYGQPDIRRALGSLQAAGVTHLVVFPLFPQYSSTTSQTAIEKTQYLLEGQDEFERVTVIEEYHDHPAYIQAVADSIQQSGVLSSQDARLLFSFHGVPQRYIRWRGEPYLDQCRSTAELVAARLGLPPDRYTVTFQSRFGPEPWLQPYTEQTLAALGAEGRQYLAVVCPGFAADCLETLEEIAIQGRETYEAAGGHGYHYIPALNDSDRHIEALLAVIQDAL
jgi:ferrochelatase